MTTMNASDRHLTLAERRPVEVIEPQMLQHEYGLLNGILCHPELLHDAMQILDKPREQFYSYRHALIFWAMTNLDRRSVPITKITVAQELRDKGKLLDAGGPEFLSELIASNNIIDSVAVEHYAKRIHEAYMLRAGIEMASEISAICYNGMSDGEEALNQVHSVYHKFATNGQKNGLTKITGLFAGQMNRMDATHAESQSPHLVGVTTGFRDIDQYLHGLRRGHFGIIAARPAMGKTSMLMNMAHYASQACELPVPIYSMEMVNNELVDRLVAFEMRVDSRKLTTGGFEPDDWEAYSRAMSSLHDSTIMINDTGSQTVTQIRSELTRLKSQYKELGPVFIDYLQLVKAADSRQGSNRNEELAEICRILKATAKDLQVPIIALSQLNRAVENRADKRPTLADLRDSGSIEQEADFVAFLYRDAYYHPENAIGNDQTTEFIIAKHRHGKTGTVNLRFVPEWTMFADENPGKY